MANKMLIDASHPEETRVVVLKGNRIEEFDFESEHKKQIKGNIYLAKVTRVEPSLQAAFVEYGGNRHGFLAFGEIHPDYYQIPVADRQALVEEDLRRAKEEEEQEERKLTRGALDDEPAIAAAAENDERVSEPFEDDARDGEATDDDGPAVSLNDEASATAVDAASPDGETADEPASAELAPH
jgi:ribonuclease E